MIWIIFLVLCLISITEVFSAASTLTYKSGDHWGPITQHTILLSIGALIVVFVSGSTTRDGLVRDMTEVSAATEDSAAVMRTPTT